MPAKDLSRWEQNEDGSWRVKVRDEVAKPAETAQAAAEAFTEVAVPKIPARYDEMTKPELEAELVLRGLSKYGNKPELITRLQEDDAG